MPKKTITPEEFIELSKVMDEREIIEQYNIVNQNQKNIFQKLKKYSANSFGFMIGNIPMLKKTIVPILTLAIIGGGYYGYQKYTEQIGWYKWQVSELEGKLKMANDNVKDGEYNIRNLQSDLDKMTTKNESEVSKHKEDNQQLLENSKLALKNLANLGSVRSCIFANINNQYTYSCSSEYQNIDCVNRIISHNCSYDGENYSCDVRTKSFISNTESISNCKKD